MPADLRRLAHVTQEIARQGDQSLGGWAGGLKAVGAVLRVQVWRRGGSSYGIICSEQKLEYGIWGDN